MNRYRQERKGERREEQEMRWAGSEVGQRLEDKVHAAAAAMFMPLCH